MATTPPVKAHGVSARAAAGADPSRRVLAAAGVFLAGLLLAGCEVGRDSFIHPGGPVARAQRDHFFWVIAITMIAVAPVLVGVPLLLLRYRLRDRKADYEPNWDFSWPLEVACWGVPFAIITVLGVMLFHNTHRLDPYRRITPNGPAALEVQVIGLDWKWLFVYPEHNIATVGEVAFPAGRDVRFSITSDTVMQSFAIRSLAGQIYAMPGMTTDLNVMAFAPGAHRGENMQFNGDYFATQKFDALAMTQGDFEVWVERVRASPVRLDARAYAVLSERSHKAALADRFPETGAPESGVYFSSVEGELFAERLGYYHTGAPIPPEQQPGAQVYDGVQPMPRAQPVHGMNHGFVRPRDIIPAAQHGRSNRVGKRREHDHDRR